jgi:hypothetical protein
MRGSRRLLALMVLAGLGACHRHAHPPSAEVATISVGGGPQPAAGLWSQSVSDRNGVRTLKYCLDGPAASSLAAFGRQLNGRCSRHDIARAADGTWRFATSCDMGTAGKVATEGVMRGDFRSHYFVEAESQTVQAADGAANGPGRVLADVQRLGDCPRDMRAGDVVLPDGGHSRLETLAAPA